MTPEPASTVSELLLHWGNGDRQALEAILPLVYNELRRLARHMLQQQRPNHTLQATALVHEAYLRLAEEKSLQVKDRVHFLGVAAQLMRWILVDYERKRRAAKRGANAVPEPHSRWPDRKAGKNQQLVTNGDKLLTPFS